MIRRSILSFTVITLAACGGGGGGGTTSTGTTSNGTTSNGTTSSITTSDSTTSSDNTNSALNNTVASTAAPASVVTELTNTNASVSEDITPSASENDQSNTSSSATSSSSSSSTSSSTSSSSSSSSSGATTSKNAEQTGELYATNLNYANMGGARKTNAYRVIGYYMPSLDGSFAPSEIGEAQANMLTHINYAFIGINENLECDFINTENRVQEAAIIAELQALKAWNPELKTLFSIGGWAESNDDSATVGRYRAAFAAENREHFANSCIAFMAEHDFDGIDIDWEYPRSEDVDNFIAGLALIRDKLNTRNRQELLTIAGAGGAFYLSRYYHQLPEIVAELDFINLMTYDLNGPWNGVDKTNFHAHLYGNSEEPRFYNALREAQLGLSWEETVERFPSPFALTVDAAIKQHLQMDIPREKLVMGVPFYGRAFFNTGDANNGLYQPFSTAKGDPYTGDPSLLIGCDTCEARNEPRIATYQEIQNLLNGNFGYSEHFDEQAKAPWLYHADNNIFVTYDNPNSLTHKTDYIKQQGLGGVMFWHLGQDDSQFSLLTTLHSQLNGDQQEQPNNAASSNPSNPSTPPIQSNNLTAPATPTIAWLAESYAGSSVELSISWDMWWGTNGNYWELLLDGNLAFNADLEANGNAAQSASASLTINGEGNHTITVSLCNKHSGEKVCASDTVSITLNASGSSAGVASAGLSAEPSANEEVNDSGSVTYGEYNNSYEQTSEKIIVSYFVEWGIYGRDYHVQDIPASNLTHLLFGFLAICEDNPHASGGAQSAIAQACADKQDYEVTMVDRFANLEKTYPGDTWYDDVEGDNYNGNFGQLRKLKQRYPHLTILPSVGGWTMTTPFYSMANDDNKRATFVESVIRFVKKYDFFDGVDIDWEYPVYGGTDPHLSSSADRQAYTELMRDLRAAFDELARETGRNYEITSAVGAAPERIDAIDYTTATSYMDYVFLMSYDFAGGWDSQTGHHTPLYDNNGPQEGFNTHDAVQNLLNAGVPANKLAVGGAFYGRGWENTQNTNPDKSALFPLYGNASPNSDGTWEASVFDYRDLHDNFIGEHGRGINGFIAEYDETAEAAYLWNPTTAEFISYDSPRSITAKAHYVNQQNLAGMITWEIDADNGKLLNAINVGFGNPQQ